MSPPVESPWFPATGTEAKTAMASESAGHENGTGGGEGRAGTAQNELGYSDNWLLATVYSWVSDGRSKEETVAKIMTSFSLKDLRDAASVMRKGEWCVPQISVTQESAAGPEYSRKLAEKVFDGLVSIQNQAPPKVHFWVSAEDLLKVPGARQHLEDQLDEQAVSARLAGVDVQLCLVLEKMKSTEQLESSVAALAKTVDELKAELKESRQLHQQQTGSMKEAALAFESAAKLFEQAKQHEGPQTQSWATVAGGRSRVRSLQSSQGQRVRSASTKRRRQEDDDTQLPSQKQRLEVLQAQEIRQAHTSPPGSSLSQDLSSLAAGAAGGFVQVKRRKKGGAPQKGSSKVEAEGGEKPPFSVFLSGTHPSTTAEVVKEKLAQCATAITVEGEEPKELKILKVEHIPLKIPNGEVPRSRCWKVQVEPEWEAHMMSSAAYPAAWCWRKWHPGPAGRGNERENGGA